MASADKKMNDGRGRYKRFGKITTPISDSEFFEGMEKDVFKKRKHKGYCVLLYYTAIRKMEGGRCVPEQFQITAEEVVFEVGKRLKHGMKTPPLHLPRELPYIEELVWAIEHTKPQTKVWNYSSKTYYNIVRRAFKYSHLFRLSRITWFFLQGWTIAQVKSWTGLTLQALDFYVGVVDIIKMGKGMIPQKHRGKKKKHED
jgi:hypothetical protein